jgi:hypothetical protein
MAAITKNRKFDKKSLKNYLRIVSGEPMQPACEIVAISRHSFYIIPWVKCLNMGQNNYYKGNMPISNYCFFVGFREKNV